MIRYFEAGGCYLQISRGQIHLDSFDSIQHLNMYGICDILLLIQSIKLETVFSLHISVGNMHTNYIMTLTTCLVQIRECIEKMDSITSKILEK